MSNQLFEDGKVIVVDDTELECTSVAYQEVDGEKQNFVYSFRLKSEVDAEREEARKAEEEAERARQEAEEAHEATLTSPVPETEANSTEPGSVETAPGDQPEEPKEETQYVK